MFLRLRGYSYNCLPVFYCADDALNSARGKSECGSGQSRSLTSKRRGEKIASDCETSKG
jgi:hypothetical protein